MCYSDGLNDANVFLRFSSCIFVTALLIFKLQKPALFMCIAPSLLLIYLWLKFIHIRMEESMWGSSEWVSVFTDFCRIGKFTLIWDSKYVIEIIKTIMCFFVFFSNTNMGICQKFIISVFQEDKTNMV